MNILTREQIAEIAASFFDPDDNTAAYGEAASVPDLIETAHAYHAAKRDSGIYAAALREAVAIIDGLADQQAMQDDWYVTQLTYLRALAACETEKDSALQCGATLGAVTCERATGHSALHCGVGPEGREYWDDEDES